MSVKDAMTVLKAHHSLLKITPQTYVHQLIPNQTLVSGVEAAIPLVAGQIFKGYKLAFSMQPSAGFVTAVRFARKARALSLHSRCPFG